MAVGPQILVLLSLGFQVALFFLAGSRRREGPKLWKLLLWLVYQLADPTTIYAIGHLTLCDTPREHRLVAFWAPFLLLHLGGPDNISAYALQDNQLWSRHLVTLVTQVSGAAYILYKHILATGGTDPSLQLAGILMFIAGLVKYAERNYALKCSKFDSIRSSLKNDDARRYQFRPPNKRLLEKAADEDERYLRKAHSLFHISRRALVDSSVKTGHDDHTLTILRSLRKEERWKGWWILMEMELSLIYDFLYTKAAVIHTWHGYCIRVFSLLVTTASFLLFQLSGKVGQSRVDIAVTYTLLVGAVLMETASLFGVLGSTWTYAFLCTTGWRWLRNKALNTGRWQQLRRIIKKIKWRCCGRRTSRRWSGKMGQYNMMHYCSRQNRALPLLGMLATIVRRKEWWKKMHYSGSINISDDLKKTLHGNINLLTTMRGMNTQGMIRKSWGQEALEQFGEYFVRRHEAQFHRHYSQLLGEQFRNKFNEQFSMHSGMGYGEKYYYCFKKYNYLGIEFQEGIIIWHIGTDVFLAKSLRDDYGGEEDLVKAIRTLSNYMMFLLVYRPYLLPGLPQIMLYQRTRDNLVKLWKPDSPDGNNMYTRFKKFFLWRDGPKLHKRVHGDKLAIMAWEQGQGYGNDLPLLHYANQVAAELLSKRGHIGTKHTLELLLYVWIDFLLYAANRCSTDFHAKKLSSGGELTTVVWIMLHCFHQEANVPMGTFMYEDPGACTIC
ncbi:hypothetical protein ACP4OV_029086 [Aristida adscensionis]